MTSKIKTFLAVIFTSFLLSVSTLACVCVRDKIKAKGFTGQVFAVIESNPNYKEPLPKATIKLLKRTDNGDETIADVVADEAGRFSLENVKAGEYILAADAPNYQAVWTEIKVVRSARRKKDEILIGLAPTIGCCEGYAKVQKAKKS
jgi:hypothetical protein